MAVRSARSCVPCWTKTRRTNVAAPTPSEPTVLASRIRTLPSHVPRAHQATTANNQAPPAKRASPTGPRLHGWVMTRPVMPGKERAATAPAVRTVAKTTRGPSTSQRRQAGSTLRRNSVPSTAAAVMGNPRAR